ncbi:T9SS type A sorting domain-containing protein [Rosettibacter firmus]|uniref:T9SS type A sorting domain-containing protein n=1 Tax=Rosettibacter firmus TaxID=3111522 RepID=UPI00336BF774
MKCKILVILLALTTVSAVFSQQLIPIQDKNGNKLLLQVNQQTGSTHRVYGELPNIKSYGFQWSDLNLMSVETLSKKFFSDYAGILRIDPAQLKLRKAETDGKMWFISYDQSINGVPDYGNEIGYTVNQSGDIVALGADAYQNISTISTTPKVTKSKAEEIAKRAFGFDSTVTEKGCELIIYPKEEKDTTFFYLTWEITLFRAYPLQEIIYFVDARNGEIVEQKNNIREGGFSGQVTGSYWPVHKYDTPVQASFKTTHIKVWNNLGQVVWEGDSNENGNYSTGSFAYTWYFIQFPLENEWVQVRDSSANPRGPIAQAKGPYTPPAVVNHDWGTTDGTNLRWHASVMHDYFKNTFNYTGMDYQIGAYINCGEYTNGAANGTDILFGIQDGQQWARSSDVIYHEYTHNVIYHIYGGWIGDPNEYFTQASAMDEGLADYFACTKNNDPNQAEDVGVNRNLNNNYTWDSTRGAHWNGQVIGSACWDLRQSVGQSIADNLFFKALQVTPHARTISDFEYNVFVVDNNYYNHSHTSQIYQAFAGHGITIPALVVSISGPTYLNGNQLGTYTATASGGIPPYSYQWEKLDVGDGGSYATATLSSPISPNRPLVNTWYPIGTNSPTVSTSNPAGLDFELKCVVTGATNISVTSNILYVNVGEGEPVPKLQSDQGVQVAKLLPVEFSIRSYPNPFNPSATISYELPTDGFVRLSIFDVLGREVETLVNEVKPAGFYDVTFDASNLPSGIYFARIYVTSNEGKPFVQTIKMVLAK